MNTESRLWQIIFVIVGLLTAFVPAYVSYDLYGRGPILEKKIELKISFINPLEDLAGLGNKVSLSTRSQTLNIDNIIIARTSISNVGRAPIVPNDYYERISVNVKKPWKILAVGNDSLFRGVEFKWNRISDSSFEAVPALLNPGDIVSANVYLTNTGDEKLSKIEKTAKPEIEWKARIVNMPAFTIAPDIASVFKKHVWGVTIDLAGWAVPFTIGAAMLFLALYLHLLTQASLLRGMGVGGIMTVLGASFLSFAAAESMATYLFNNTIYALLNRGTPHLLNAPWIILHVFFLVFLLVKVKRRERAS